MVSILRPMMANTLQDRGFGRRDDVRSWGKTGSGVLGPSGLILTRLRHADRDDIDQFSREVSCGDMSWRVAKAGPEPRSTALIYIKDLCDQVRENLSCFIVIVTEQLRRLCS